MYDFQTISINHTGVFTTGLRTELIPFCCNRAAGPTKRGTGINFLGGRRWGSWEGRQWIPTCDKPQRWMKQTISPFVSRWLFQSVALKQTEPKQEAFDSVLRQRSKLLKYSPNDGLCFTRTTRYEWEYLFYLREIEAEIFLSWVLTSLRWPDIRGPGKNGYRNEFTKAI